VSLNCALFCSIVAVDPRRILRASRRGYDFRPTSSKETAMVVTELRLPELAMVVGTRAMLGAGVALLLADKVSGSTRKSVGWGLVAVGVLTTVPAAMLVLGRRRKVE